jgi:hypothetical protein
MSDRETPGQDDQIDGWRIRWTSRRRYALIGGEAKAIHEPVLELRKPGRQWIEVKGQAGIDRPCMLAHGMVSASLYEAEAERWRQLVRIRTNTAAVGRVGGRLLAGTAGARPRGA